jgi:hypothetical protein
MFANLDGTDERSLRTIPFGLNESSGLLDVDEYFEFIFDDDTFGGSGGSGRS